AFVGRLQALLALAKSFVRPPAFKHNFRLVCTDSKQELFRLRGEVRPSRTSRNKAVSPVAKRQDNHTCAATSAGIRYGMHTDCIRPEPRREPLTEGLRRLGWPVRANRLQIGPLVSTDMHVNKVQQQRALEHLSQATDDVQWARLGPHGRQCGERHQIAEAPLKVLEFPCSSSRWRHGFYFTAFCCCRSRNSLKNSSGGTKNGFC